MDDPRREPAGVVHLGRLDRCPVGAQREFEVGAFLSALRARFRSHPVGVPQQVGREPPVVVLGRPAQRDQLAFENVPLVLAAWRARQQNA